MNNRTRAAALAVLLVTASLPRLGAQRLAPAVLGFSAPGLSVGTDTAPRPSTYWLEGAVVGGLVTGLPTAALANGFCNDSDSNPSGHGCLLPTVEGLLIGAIPGVVLGAIIGGGFHKHSRT